MASATIRDPQSFNRNTYAMNSPYKFTDPLGLLSQYTTGANGRNWDSYGIGSPGGAFSSALSGFHRNKEPYGGDTVWNFVVTSNVVEDGQNHGTITDSAYDYAKKYLVDPNYDQCHGNNNGLPGREQSILALAAGAFDADLAAQIGGIWSHESNFGINDVYGDAGPAQLTTWWSRNHPELIVGNAYGSWNGRLYPGKDQPFDGSVRDNVATLRNIVLFSNDRYGSFYKTAYWYGPGDPSNPKNAPNNRREYAADVMRRYDKLKPFFDCLKR